MKAWGRWKVEGEALRKRRRREEEGVEGGGAGGREIIKSGED